MIKNKGQLPGESTIPAAGNPFAKLFGGLGKTQGLNPLAKAFG